ncbi:MAG: CHAT domain-containing protein, partial [Cyanobacteria bacterium J06649_5]
MSSVSTVKKILLLAANPKATTQLRLDEEVREIDEALRIAKNRESFDLVQKWATRPRDMQRALLDVQPNIVHFSGHGTGEDGLVMEGANGKVQLVSTEALASLFELHADDVDCVLLSACYSESQAAAIAKYVPYVIGMNDAVGDKAA